jgi:UDP-N-acetylglucosamine 1-carboxyvinyltransferase
MDRIRIEGGQVLTGKIKAAGAKNAVLPIMAASILTDQGLELLNVPDLVDVSTMCSLLENFGVLVKRDYASGRMLINANKVSSTVAPYDIVCKMRASILVLGPLLARFGSAHVSLPGGCAIGTRPIDLHIDALEAMGAKITIEEGYVKASVNGKLQGSRIRFKAISVGATENIMMAAVLAQGTTYLENVAIEPEVIDLGECLIKMGAKISGLGTREIKIEGVDKLNFALHSVIPDRIEAGTFLIAAAITGGHLEIDNVRPEHLEAVLHKLRETGVDIVCGKDTITLDARGVKLHSVNIKTGEYPSFPTDMQAQFMSLMTVADGSSIIEENIFENRFMHVAELLRMGADIKVDKNDAIVRSVSKLKGAQVMATDLRASVSLVIAALAADGVTEISRVYHLDRGYENIEKKLSACGVKISRITA